MTEEWKTPAMVKAEQAMAEAEEQVDAAIAEADRVQAELAAKDEQPPVDLDEDLEESQLRLD